MSRKMEYSGKNQIGDQRSTNGSSVALNGQRGEGCLKPSEKGNHNPGGTRPEMDGRGSVPNAIVGRE